VQKYLISLLPFPISNSQKDTTRNVFFKSLFYCRFICRQMWNRNWYTT